jgi:two-component system CheB/CheR fusion protein
MQRDADRFLIGEFVPPCVLVNEALEVVQFRGKTGAYFEHSPGFASFDLLGMLKEGLASDVKKLLESAHTTNASARKEGIPLINGESHRISIEAFPMNLGATGERYFILLFEEENEPKFKATKIRRQIKKAASVMPDESQQLTALRAELATSKSYLQAVNEEKEASNEELKAANEEVMSTNEELQSTNEELHSAKEELQSTNEELITVNDELKLRNRDLGNLNDDLANLLNSLNSALILLTKDLRVRRFTPLAEKLFRLLPTDVGRPIEDIRPNVEIRDLQKLTAEVVSTVIPKELEVQSEDGRWYLLQIKPYRTCDDRINGAVLLFTDITYLKENVVYTEAVEGIIAHPLIVLTGNLTVKRANKKFYEVFQTTPTETENHFFYKLGTGQWDLPGLRKLLGEILPKQSEFTDYLVTENFPHIGRTTFYLSGRRLFYHDKSTETILLTMRPAK